MSCEDRCLKRIEEVENELESVKRILAAVIESQNIHGILKCKISQKNSHIGTGMFRMSFGMDTYLYIYEGVKEHSILLNELKFEQYIDYDNIVFDVDGDFVKFTITVPDGWKYYYTVNYKNGSYIYEKKYDK